MEPAGRFHVASSWSAPGSRGPGGSAPASSLLILPPRLDRHEVNAHTSRRRGVRLVTHIRVGCPPSTASSNRLRSTPPVYPPRPPVECSTRWQGTTIGSGFE